MCFMKRLLICVSDAVLLSSAPLKIPHCTTPVPVPRFFIRAPNLSGPRVHGPLASTTASVACNFPLPSPVLHGEASPQFSMDAGRTMVDNVQRTPKSRRPHPTSIDALPRTWNTQEGVLTFDGREGRPLVNLHMQIREQVRTNGDTIPSPKAATDFRDIFHPQMLRRAGAQSISCFCCH